MSQLSRSDAQKRLEKLRDLINEYRYQYNVHDKSVMSEAAADSLKHELSIIEAQYPDLITSDSPSQRVAGRPLAKFTSVPHLHRMLSLNDVFDETEVKAWVQRITKLQPKATDQGLWADIKMDGLACTLIYQDGLLSQALTRGDGQSGEDVTMNVRTIDSVPLRLRRAKGLEQLHRGRTEVRGEIVMYKSDFEKLNELRAAKNLPLFANPRNLSAGTIRQLDPRLVVQRPLHFRAYDLIREDNSELPTHEYIYNATQKLGFLINKQATTVQNVKDIMEFADKWEHKRKSLAFNTDGLVIKVNNKEMYVKLGVVGKAPRGAVAFKFPAEQATTKVKDIFVSIGRTGAATPVAMLEAVVVAGSTVQMATLHNESEVQRKDIRIGDTVIIHKAGDIIPEIIEPLVKLRNGSEKPFAMPKQCPECNTTLVKLKAADAVWRCPNQACPSRSWKRIEHFASKSALDIEGLGEKNVIALLEAGLIKDQADIYNLRKEDVLGLERFAEVSATKLVLSIQSKKQPPLARFLYGLGIRHVGVQTAIDLVNHFHELQNIAEATIEELSKVDGVGEVVAESVVAWFALKSNYSLLEKFTKLGVEPIPVKKTGGPLQGLNFVVTGSLDSMGREEAAEAIRALGGTFQSAVGQDTDYLVVGANVGASKLAKAAKLGTKQIDEAEFANLLKG